MDGTLFVARAQEQFSGGYAIYFWVRSAPLVAPTSHPLRTHLPYGKDKGFMGGTLFALAAYFNSTERLSQQLRKRSSIHGLHGSISSQTAIEEAFSEVAASPRPNTLSPLTLTPNALAHNT